MKKLFLDDKGNLSMGRMLSFLLFFVCTLVWIIIKVTGKELTNNDMSLIQIGWITSIGGKALQRFAEKK